MISNFLIKTGELIVRGFLFTVGMCLFMIGMVILYGIAKVLIN